MARQNLSLENDLRLFGKYSSSTITPIRTSLKFFIPGLVIMNEKTKEKSVLDRHGNQFHAQLLTKGT